MSQTSDLQKAAADLRKAETDQATREDAIIALLKAAPNSPEVATVIAELQSQKAALDTRDQPPPPAPSTPGIPGTKADLDAATK